MSFYLSTILILFLASIIQSALGFAFALFATPLLTFTGLALPSVVALVSSCSFLQSLVGIIKLRKELPVKPFLSATLIRSLSVISGILLLRKAVNLDTVALRMMVGLLLCLLVILQIICQPKAHKSLSWYWALLAFSASGFLSGLTGMGGPPLVLWVMALDWSNNQSRAFLFATFSAAIPVQLILLSLNFGKGIWTDFVFALAITPIIYLGSIIGLYIGQKLSKERLKKYAYAVLLLIGISSIIPFFLGKR